jgi:hypothetical protein
MNSTARPERVGEVWTRLEGDETAIFEPVSQRLIRLNASARAIWELCDGETEVTEVVEALVELTGRPEEEVTSEVDATLESLRDLGLVT